MKIYSPKDFMNIKMESNTMQFVYTNTYLNAQSKPTCIAFELSPNHKCKVQCNPDVLANHHFLGKAMLHIKQEFVGMCLTTMTQLMEFLMEAKIMSTSSFDNDYQKITSDEATKQLEAEDAYIT